jgi:hypothetical protein
MRESYSLRVASVRPSSARPHAAGPWTCAGVHDRPVRSLLAWLLALSAWEARGLSVRWCTGARIMAVAAPGEILVSATVLDLVDGSGLAFEDAGRHELKGAAARQLYRVA